MSRFAQRSSQKELIDEAGIPFAHWEVCLRELNNVNTYLGGHAITIEGVSRLLGHLKNSGRKEIVICEIGTGGGDNLKAIHKWQQDRSENSVFRYVGIDINPACTEFAEKNCKGMDAQFICSDYKLVNFEIKPDIIFNSLFCHHFSNEQLVEMLRWMKSNATAGFFINDLQRHPVAYYSIMFITRMFSRSYLVRHDAPVSVNRGFLKKEWESLLKQAGISDYEISWKWAFRYLVLVANEQ